MARAGPAASPLDQCFRRNWWIGPWHKGRPGSQGENLAVEPKGRLWWKGAWAALEKMLELECARHRC